MTDFIYLKITKRSEKGLFSLLIESKNYLFESFKLFLLKNQKKKSLGKQFSKKSKSIWCVWKTIHANANYSKTKWRIQKTVVVVVCSWNERKSTIERGVLFALCLFRRGTKDNQKEKARNFQSLLLNAIKCAMYYAATFLSRWW